MTAHGQPSHAGVEAAGYSEISAGAPSGQPRTVRLAAVVAPPVVYASIAAHYFSNFLAHPTRGVPGGADGILYAWYFEWVRQSVVHLHNPLFSPDMNAPFGLNLMWNTALFAVAVLCIPLTATIGAVATVGFMMVLAPVASASTCYFVLRRLTRRSLSSALVATIYGFGPFFVGQQGHLHLSIAVFPPLLLLFGHRLLVDQTSSPVRTGLWFGVVLGLQMLVSEEMVVLAAVVAAFSALLLAWLNPDAVRGRRRRVVTGLGVAAAVTVVIAGFPLAYQFFGLHALQRGIGFKAQRLDLAGIVRPSGLQYFASHADKIANNAFPANSVENTGYLGWPLVVLVLCLAVRYIRKGERWGNWWLGTTIIAVLFSLGSKIQVDGITVSPGPWIVLRFLPLLGGVVTARFSLITTLLVVVILGRWLAELRGRRLALGSLIVMVAALPLLPAGRYDQISYVRTPLFFTSSTIAVIGQRAAVYVMPYSDNADVAARVMFWQLRTHLRFRIIGGYSVFEQNGAMTYHPVLPDYARLLNGAARTGVPPTAAELAVARPSVKTSRTRYIVVTQQETHRDVVTRAARQLTGCAPTTVADVTLCAVP